MNYSKDKIVKIINYGSIYPRYEEMADKLDATNWHKNYANEARKEKNTWKVINKHENKHIYLIENIYSSHQILIGERGIKLKKIEEFIKEEEFSI